MREYPTNEQLNGCGDSVDGKSSLGPAEGYSDAESPTQCIITYRYKRGNVEFEMQPINGGQDGDEDGSRAEEGRSGRLNGDTRSYTSPRFEDVDDDRSPLGPRCIKEEKPLTQDFLLAPSDDSTPKSAGDAKIHVRGSENGHSLAPSQQLRSMESKTSLSPPGNINYNSNSFASRRFTPIDRKEDGVEGKRNNLLSQANGRAVRKKTPRNAKEKNVKNSYKQGESLMGAQSIDKILEDLGYVDIPETAQGKSRKAGNNRLVKSDRGKPKIDGSDVSGEGMRRQSDEYANEDEAELEVPLELDPDVVGHLQPRENSATSPPPRSSSPPSITTNSSTSNNDNSDEKSNGASDCDTGDKESSDNSPSTIQLRLLNPLIQFTRQQLRQMSDKEKKARWIYDSPNDGALTLPSADEYAQEWAQLKARWENFLNSRGEKPVYYNRQMMRLEQVGDGNARLPAASKSQSTQSVGGRKKKLPQTRSSGKCSGRY